MPTEPDMDAVLAALRRGERFVVTSHENPDGDALGSLLAAHLILQALGKGSVMVLGDELHLPAEYAFLALPDHGLLREPPPDANIRTLLVVDCAQESRIAARGLIGGTRETINIDHHHDNTRYGDVNLVVADASSTAEVVADIASQLGVSLTPPVAQALYTGLVTDTGRFQYSNTSPKALRLAADLLEAGADAPEVFRNVYESIPFAKLKLLCRAFDNAETYEEGRVVVTVLSRADFMASGAKEAHSEGIIDHLRAVDGAELSLFIRELPDERGHGYKGSLRSSSDELDVSVIARGFGGGGHRRAAGFSSDLSAAEITERIVKAFRDARG